MMSRYREAAELAIRRCRELATYTEEPNHVTRTYLSPPMHAVHALLTDWMRPAGCRVHVDAAGNIRGAWPGSSAEAVPLLIGSHLDTVPHAGMFDGILGVVLALALVETRPPQRIEIIGFSEEEGVRYGVPFIGSRALTASLDVEIMQKISPAICDFGLDPEQLPAAEMRDAAGYLEFHIEQGPVLENLGLPLGVVESIAGQSRAVVEFHGRANHAGTTPMSLRQDALAAAAHWIAAVESLARQTPHLVATVGNLSVEPGASNVIPALARATLDVRHPDDGVRCSAVDRLRHASEEIAQARKLTVVWQTRMEQPAVAMDSQLTGLLADAVAQAGFPAHRMCSGAGHDAMILARRFPSTMLFVRSPGGVSHHPDETVLADDVAAAIAAGVCFLERYA